MTGHGCEVLCIWERGGGLAEVGERIPKPAMVVGVTHSANGIVGIIEVHDAREGSVRSFYYEWLFCVWFDEKNC